MNLSQDLILNEIKSRTESIDLNSVEIFDPDFDKDYWRYSLIMRLTKSLKPTFQNIINEIQIIQPDQYYYHIDVIHATIFTGLKAENNPEVVKSKLEKLISNSTIKFKLKGLYITKKGVGIIAIPDGFNLKELRDNIRNEFGEYGKDLNAKGSETYDYISWLNFVRFNHYPSQELKSFCLENSMTDYGNLFNPELILVRTSSQLQETSRTDFVTVLSNI